MRCVARQRKKVASSNLKFLVNLTQRTIATIANIATIATSRRLNTYSP